MGEVIRKTAAAEDILADVASTLLRATAKGGLWQSEAAELLAPVHVLSQGVEGRLKAAEEASAPLSAALQAEDEKADDLLGQVYDMLWNEAGRPASDPFLELLFPQGSSYYTQGPLDQQPDRFELLAELLEAGLHPRISAESAQAKAAEVRAAAEALRAVASAAAKPRTQAELLSRVRTAVAKAAQVKLASLKRMYKAHGFSEAEIHAVIPDRSKPAASGGQAVPSEQTASAAAEA